jgi:Domain of unknown function (DUF4386)
MEFKLDKKSARIAGALYLVVAVLGIFSEFFVRGKLIVPGQISQTAHNIAANEGLYRLGLASDIICQLSHFFLVFVLYYMFRQVSKPAAALMVGCVLVSVAMTLVNLANHADALIWLSEAEYLRVFSIEQMKAMMQVVLLKHSFGYTLAGVFFGLWLYPLGHLVQHSGRFPKILGIMLKIGCFGYLIDTFVTVLAPAYKVTVSPVLAVAGVAELALCLYLLIVGLKEEQ